MTEPSQFNSSDWLNPNEPKASTSGEQPPTGQVPVASQPNQVPGPQVQSEPVASVPVQPDLPQKPRRTGRIVLGFILLVLIGGGGALAWYQSPNAVLQRLQSGWLLQQNEFAYTSQTVLKLDPTKLGAEMQAASAIAGKPIPDSIPSDIGGTLTVNGEVDAKDQKDVRTHTTVELSALGLSADLEVTTIADIFYIKATKISDFPLFDTSSFKDKWIKIDPAVVAKDMNVEEGYTKYKTDSTLTDAQVKQLTNLLKQSKILTITKKFPLTSIDSSLAHHYLLAIDPAALTKFIADANPIVSKDPLPAGALDQYKQDFRAIQKTSLETWIDFISGQPHRLTITAPLQLNDGPQYGELKSTLNLTHVGQKPTIEAPTTSVPLKQIIDEFTAKQEAADSAAATDTPSTDSLMH